MKKYEYHISLEVMFQALSSLPRMQIMQLLANHPSCVNVVSKKLGFSQTAVSQHLRLLRLAGIVECEKHGKEAHYSVRVEALEALREFLRSLCICCCNENSEEYNCEENCEENRDCQ